VEFSYDEFIEEQDVPDKKNMSTRMGRDDRSKPAQT
jgi:hypothetical protein